MNEYEKRFNELQKYSNDSEAFITKSMKFFQEHHIGPQNISGKDAYIIESTRYILRSKEAIDKGIKVISDLKSWKGDMGDYITSKQGGLMVRSILIGLAIAAFSGIGLFVFGMTFGDVLSEISIHFLRAILLNPVVAVVSSGGLGLVAMIVYNIKERLANRRASRS